MAEARDRDGDERPNSIGERRGQLAIPALLGLLAWMIAALVIHPQDGAPLASDTASAVIHFQRLTAGLHLEGVIYTTPKPLLTIALGLTHELGGGWLGISLMTITVWAAAVACGARLAWRLAGPGAALAVAAVLIASRSMLLEVAWGLGSVWALLGWFAAGLAVTGSRPRWRTAGTLLALAALARIETFLLLALATIAIVALRALTDRGPKPRLAGAWWLAIGWLALPMMLVHDWLLTGDPLYWLGCATRYSAALIARWGPSAVPGAGAVLVNVVHVALDRMPLTIAAVAGVAWLARRREAAPLAGLIAFGPGVAALLVVLAMRQVYVDPRYYVPIELTIVFAAGIGLGALVELATRAVIVRPGRLPPDALRASLIALTTCVAVFGSGTIAPLDRMTLDRLALFRAWATTSDLAEPVLRHEIARVPGVGAWPGEGALAGEDGSSMFIVPTPIHTRLVADLHVPIPRFAPLDPSMTDPATTSLVAGQVVVHSAADAPAGAYLVLETERRAVIGPVRLEPLLADARAGSWILRVVPSAP